MALCLYAYVCPVYYLPWDKNILQSQRVDAYHQVQENYAYIHIWLLENPPIKTKHPLLKN